MHLIFRYRTSVNIYSGCYAAILMVLTLLWTGVRGECPVNIKESTDNCFRSYKTHYDTMKNSPRTLFSGVNVEMLRRFCTSYMDAMRCASGLTADCPESSQVQIRQTVASMDAYAARDELAHLCRDDVIYEVYARHQNCYATQGNHSEKCFEKIMNTSVRAVNGTAKIQNDKLCSNMRYLISCIGTNIDKKCGSEAATIVEILVKPMVARSTRCDYNIVTPTTKPQNNRHGNQNVGSGGGKSPQGQRDPNGCLPISYNAYLVTILAMITFFHSMYKT